MDPQTITQQIMKAKRLTPITCVLALLTTAPLTFAQSTTDEKGVEKTTVVETKAAVKPGSLSALIRDSVTYSILNKALVATGLDVTLGDKPAYTIFAPTDDAFGKLPKGALDQLLLPQNKEKLRALLLHHVVAGENPPNWLKDGQKITCMHGEMLEIDVDGSSSKVNDAKISGTPIAANNGSFYPIDKVLIPKSLDGFAGLDD